MQNASGSFGVWGPGSADLWLTGYVMDFMTRAKEQGFTVKESGYRLALDRLQNFVVNASDFKRAVNRAPMRSMFWRVTVVHPSVSCGITPMPASSGSPRRLRALKLVPRWR